MKKRSYRETIEKFPKARILVVGDVMLDHYISGEVERISPEAPVPIVLERSREYFLGGAGNVAANIVALGGNAALAGAVGDDVEGKYVLKLCRERNITPYLVKQKERPTARKARILAGSHQLLRLDRELIGDISHSVERKVARAIKSSGEYDLVVISDYAKGFLTEGVIGAIKKRFGSKRIIANIKPSAKLAPYKNIRLATLNAKEAYDLTRIQTSTDAGTARAAAALSRAMGASMVVTRGEHGMTVYDRELKRASHISSSALNVFDVTGAGDTVIAALALMQANGATLAESALVANRAAGMVVGAKGTATVRPEELLAKLS